MCLSVCLCVRVLNLCVLAVRYSVVLCVVFCVFVVFVLLCVCGFVSLMSLHAVCECSCDDVWCSMCMCVCELFVWFLCNVLCDVVWCVYA